MVQISWSSVISACRPSSGQSGPGRGNSAVPQWGVPSPPHPQVKVSTSWQGQGRYYYVQWDSVIGIPRDDIRRILLHLHAFVQINTVIAKKTKRIKWILLHVCTWTSTIEHAYSNCPRDKSGILLSTRTLTVEHNYHKAPRNKRFLINYNCYLFYLYLKNREMNLTSL